MDDMMMSHVEKEINIVDINIEKFCDLQNTICKLKLYLFKALICFVSFNNSQFEKKTFFDILFINLQKKTKL